VRRKNPRVKLTAQLDGGGHERGMRSGTLNVPGIVGFGKACDICRSELEEEAKRIKVLRDKLENALLQIGGAQVNGDTMQRLPQVSNISFEQVDGEALMMNLNKNIAVSSGAACTSASLEPSYVLKAIGLDDNLAHSSIRFSLGRFTTEEQIDYAIDEVAKVINELKQSRPFISDFEVSKHGNDTIFD
jgi:cysteine desulfurase